MRYLNTYEGFFSNIKKYFRKDNRLTLPRDSEEWYYYEIELLESLNFENIYDTKDIDEKIFYPYIFNDKKYDICIDSVHNKGDYGLQQKYIELWKKFFIVIINGIEKDFDTLYDALKYIFNDDFQEYYLEKYPKKSVILYKEHLLNNKMRDKYDYIIDSEELGLLENFDKDKWYEYKRMYLEIKYYNPSKDLYIVFADGKAYTDCFVEIVDGAFEVYPQGSKWDINTFEEQKDILLKGYYPVTYDETIEDQLNFLQEQEQMGLLESNKYNNVKGKVIIKYKKIIILYDFYNGYEYNAVEFHINTLHNTVCRKDYKNETLHHPSILLKYPEILEYCIIARNSQFMKHFKIIYDAWMNDPEMKDFLEIYEESKDLGLL